MKVKEICSVGVASCTPETNLGEAALILRDSDAGALPVVDEAGRVVGILTARDLGLALAAPGGPGRSTRVGKVIGPKVHTCRSEDGAREALRTMRTERVRRLPVVDGAGVLWGLLTFQDIAMAAKPERQADPTDVTYEDLALALKTMEAGRRVAAAPPVTRTATFV